MNRYLPWYSLAWTRFFLLAQMMKPTYLSGKRPKITAFKGHKGHKAKKAKTVKRISMAQNAQNGLIQREMQK